MKRSSNGRASRRPVPMWGLVWVVMLGGMAAMAGSAAAQSLADTDDVLDGTRYLVRADDLVLADPYPLSSSQTEVAYFDLETEDMVIASPASKAAKAVVNPQCTAAGNPVNNPFPQQTQPLRMFDLPYDVIVTLAPTKLSGEVTSGCSSRVANNMTFYVDDPQTGQRHTTAVGSAGMSTGWLQTAVADFDGDGYDDLVIVTSEFVYVATAHDPTSFSSGVVIASSLQLNQTPMADPAVGDFNADGNLDVAWMAANFNNGAVPAVHFATVCAGPIEGTVCAGAESFTIRSSSATIAPSAPTGSIVKVGGNCTKNENNQVGDELRSPAMAVAAGQFDSTPGHELVVFALYEDSGKECKVVAESYRFTQFSGSTGVQLAPAQAHVLDNLGPHSDIGKPSAIYATAGRLDWSASTDNVAVAISSAQNHNVLVISLGDGLVMTSRHHSFSSDHNKSFAGIAIGRFSSAPAPEASISCQQDADCTDVCRNEICDISGADCTANGDCTGTCTSTGTCSYITSSDYDLQFAAFLMSRNPDNNSNVYVYSAEARDGFTPKELQLFNVDHFVQPAMNIAYRGGSLLRAGDLQGRSQRLGAPQVIRVESDLQPDLIVGVPPMHADWLPFADVGETMFCDPTPNDCPSSFSPSNICNCTDLVSNSTCADGRELHCLFNFSTLAGEYTSRFEFEQTQNNQSETTETTSWGLALSGELKVKAKVPGGEGETTVGYELSGEAAYDNTVSKTNSTYKSTSFNAATSTGYFDHVWYTERDYNVFYYPVIGQKLCADTCEQGSTCSISRGPCQSDADCPDAPDTCDDDDKVQLYVQFAGSSAVTSLSADGGSLEWYQPVHEPGQALSYPWDCEQLASRNGVNICDDSSSDYSRLSEAAAFSTDTSDQEYTLTWKGGGDRSKTVDKGGDFSQKVTLSVSQSTPLYEESEAGTKFKASASLGANEAIKVGRTNTSSFDASTGITVARPGTFLTPGKFAYLVDGYIFGDAPKANADSDPTDADVHAHGILQSAFTVDVRTGSSGAWWESGAYNKFVDIALNRPAHLKPDPGVGFSDPALTNCLPVSDDNISTDDCVGAFPANPTAQGLFSSQFYWLRGFFVTPDDAVGQGPQLAQAEEGDVLALQARIYNYSLQDMNVGTVKVDFYAQEWDPQCNTPAGYYDHDQNCTQPGGGVLPCENSCDPCCIANRPVDSIYIGQDVLGPLPGFQSANLSGQPNWTIARTTFDTADPSICGSRGCGDKDFLFWIVAWPELTDNQGQPALRAELPDHSLTKIPGRLDSIADLCTLANDCVNGTCRATRDACVADADCPTAEENICGSDGTCTISGTACGVDEDCGECLCEVCIDEFSNNVGFFHQGFVIQPAAATTASTSGVAVEPEKGELVIEHVTVTPAAARPGEDVVVRVGLRAIGAHINGQSVRFYAVPPDAADLTIEEVFQTITPFEVESLSRIREGRIHQAQAPYYSRRTGTHQIYVSAIIDGEEQLIGSAEVEVGDAVPTPTEAVATATPTTTMGGSEDDGCAVTSGNPSSGAAFALLAFPLLVAVLRSRSRA